MGMNPLRLGIFSALQDVADKQQARQQVKDAQAIAAEDRAHKRTLEDAMLKRQSTMDARQATLDRAQLHSRAIEDMLHETQIGAARQKASGVQRGRNMPSNVLEKMVGVDNMRSAAEGVQRSLEDAVASGTNATGTTFGFKTPTRIKNLFGMGGEKGQRTRNIIGSLKGQIAKERAGSAMSPAELDLLESYIPTDNDDERVAISKAKDFIKSLDQIKANRQAVYSKYGYGSPDSEQLPEGQDDDRLPYSSYEP